jgi:hypothetical protein
MFGDDELINDHKYEYSIICVSEIAELIFLNKKDFFKKVFSDENSKRFLLSTIKTKKEWRQEHYETIKKILIHKRSKKRNALKYFEKKRESTRNSNLEKRLFFTSPSFRTEGSTNTEKNISNAIISNKQQDFDGEYFSFKMETVRKLEYLEKCKNLKEKIGFFPIKRNVLEFYIKNNKKSFKLERDIKNLQEAKIKRPNYNKSEHKSANRISFESDNLNSCRIRTSWSKKNRINDNLMISSFDKLEKIGFQTSEKKENMEAEDKKNEIFQKFKKNIQNIFIYHYKKNKSAAETKEDTFFSINSKRLNHKLIFVYHYFF